MANTKEIITCPVCGKDMEKVYSKDNILCLDICLNGCGGIFFDNRELKKVDEKNENIDFILEAVKDKEFKNTDTNEQLVCPSCGSLMVKNHTNFKGGVEIDECYACGGKFLNSGELTKIRQEYENEDERKQAFNEFLADELRKMQSEG